MRGCDRFGSALYTDDNGVPSSEFAIGAVRGQSGYSIDVEMTNDSFEAHQDVLTAILGSFRLTP